MADYALNPNGLTDSSTEFRGVTNSIINAIQDLDAAAKTYAEMNQGEALGAYNAAHAKFTAGIAQMNAALEKGASNLDAIRDTYELGDRQGAALFGGHI
ncbi:WXG100 family type VII secretion target [Catenuloplanes sp. NPDC051500]|uniref:WXG100 family type VII secretion target n=1 Tax=Catenuloplanes sp. NPDC051500 TaxID=3363959 RepID=UPI00379EEB14